MSRVIKALYKIAAKIPPAVDIAAQFITPWEGGPKDANGNYRVYRCPAGVETIGTGCTDPKVIEKYRTTGMTPAQNQQQVSGRLSSGWNYMNQQYPKFGGLDPRQQAALLSLRDNIGAGNFDKSTLAGYLRSGQLSKIPEEFPRWKYGGGKVLPGLVKRRAAEARLWSQPEPQLTEEDFAAAEAARVKKPVQEPEIPGITNGRP